MKVQLPDGSLLLAALDAMAKNLLSEHAQVAFRVSLNRHQLRLDYRADTELVEAYARNLMAEFEVVSLSQASTASPKKPLLRKAKEKSPGIPPSSSPLSASGANPGASVPCSNNAPPSKSPPPKAPISSKPCVNWLSDGGCPYGSKCCFAHDKETEALKGRCFFCSAKDHWANLCPIKAAEKQEEQAKSRQRSKALGGKSEGKGKSGLKGESGVRSLDPAGSAEAPSSSSAYSSGKDYSGRSP